MLHVGAVAFLEPVFPQRRSLRLGAYDDTQAGSYFVTICTHHRRCLFGEIVNGTMVKNKWGEIVAACWAEITAHFVNTELDAFVVMPNHVHGIVNIVSRPMEATHGSSLPINRSLCVSALPAVVGKTHASTLRPGAVGAVVGSFKAAVTRQVRLAAGATDGSSARIWQRNYYEHVIRDEADIIRVRQYIADNPGRWAQDVENP